MTWRLLTIVLLGWQLAGCSISSTEPFAYGEPLMGGAHGVPLYFVLDDSVQPTLRSGDSTLPLQERLDLLVAGPTDTELAAGLTTALPPGVRLSYEDIQPLVLRVGVRVDGATLQDLDEKATTQIACTVAVSPAPAGKGGTGLALRAAGYDEVVELDCPL